MKKRVTYWCHALLILMGRSHLHRTAYLNKNVLIGLMQLGTRCSDGSCQAHEDLIAGFFAIEAEAELVQVRLKLCTATVVCAEQKRFQVADSLVQPMQIAGLIFFRVQRNAGQIPIKADVTYCTVYGRYKTT